MQIAVTDAMRRARLRDTSGDYRRIRLQTPQFLPSLQEFSSSS
jgi:hypothetical protein